MKAVAVALLLALVPAAAFAATPSPQPSTAIYHKVPTPLTNPSVRKPGQQNMSGQGCIGPNANAGQTEINPITGKAQSATIVAIPVTGGNVATSTTHAQQLHACGHPH